MSSQCPSESRCMSKQNFVSPNHWNKPKLIMRFGSGLLLDFLNGFYLIIRSVLQTLLPKPIDFLTWRDHVNGVQVASNMMSKGLQAMALSGI